MQVGFKFILLISFELGDIEKVKKIGVIPFEFICDKIKVCKSD